jgi:hypothetical protein
VGKTNETNDEATRYTAQSPTPSDEHYRGIGPGSIPSLLSIAYSSKAELLLRAFVDRRARRVICIQRESSKRARFQYLGRYVCEENRPRLSMLATRIQMGSKILVKAESRLATRNKANSCLWPRCRSFRSLGARIMLHGGGNGSICQRDYGS